MLDNFDEAILDRVQLKLKYDDLDSSARRSIFDYFLKEVKVDIEEEELSKFVEIHLNGRQIKNIVKIAYNIALSDSVKLSATHIRVALTANSYSIPAQDALAFDNSLYEE